MQDDSRKIWKTTNELRNKQNDDKQLKEINVAINLYQEKVLADLMNNPFISTGVYPGLEGHTDTVNVNTTYVPL